ncbi:MAG: DJ-1/PfpI family protein, partial [Paludibacteraceae bacterium]|nr:DJ-1/PfpI family protein [Paludibacteraceae bacterium]
ADKLFEDINFNDVHILILPGGMPGTNNLNQHIGLKNLIIEFYNNNKWIAAICAAPMILGQLGILKNRLATCYPGYEKYLDGATLMQDGVVVSDKIITCKGAGLSLDFAFAITNAIVGNKTTDELKEKMIFQ